MKKSFQTRPVLAWALYDFANSAYATSMLAVLFSVYFVQKLVPAGGVVWLGMRIPAESVWSYLVSAVMATVILVAPFLGRLADQRGWKRGLLFVWTLVGGLSTLFLFGAKPGHFLFGLLFGYVSFLGYEMAVVFYNSFLTDVVEESWVGRVSGWGFALGYLGGGVCLALNLVMIAKPALFGLTTEAALPIRASFFVVGVWWLVFSIPALLWLRDRPSTAVSSEGWIKTFIKTGLEVLHTARQALSMKDLWRFLLAFILYNDGIQTLLVMAAVFGSQALGMSPIQLGLCILMIQFVAFIGAMVFGPLADRWSHRNVILVTLVVYSVISIWAIFMKTQMEFWIMGAVIGLVMGGSQSASRSLYRLLIPPAQSAEFFSFYGIVGKAASLMGPFIFGLVTQVATLRAAVGSLIVFFLLGGAILLSVNETRGRLPYTPSPRP